MTPLQKLNQLDQIAIVEANIRMTEALMSQLKQLSSAADQLDWLSETEEQWLHYSDFVKGLSDSAWLSGVKTEVRRFVPYLLAVVVDPMLKLELEQAKR